MIAYRSPLRKRRREAPEGVWGGRSEPMPVAEADAAMPKPNLVFIFTDEQRLDTMRAYGNERIRTPNLDALARGAVVFANAYVTQPVCSPSRASIMTGLYPHTCGCVANNIPLPGEIPTIAEMFKDSDYRFAYHGKWHLGDEIFAQHGFTDWISIEDGYRKHYGPGRDPTAHCSYYQWLVAQGFTPEGGDADFAVFPRRQNAGFPAEYSKPEFLARTASRFIRENREHPFVLYVNYLEPHMPFTGPYDQMYRPEEVTLPANFDTPPHPDEPLKCRHLRQRYAQGSGERDLSTEAGWRRLIANYWGLVSLVDESVGRILATLSECGLDERTLVVFTSDHGDMMGSHRLLAKTVMYQEAVRVPLLMRIPWLSATPGRMDAPVSQIDLVATLLDLLGQPVPGTQGHSLGPLLEGRGGPAEDHVFIEWNGRDGEPEPREGTAERASGSAIRGVISPDGWKLNLSAADKSELYHLAADPLETENLFYSGRHDAVIRHLSDRIRRWQEETGDGVSVM